MSQTLRIALESKNKQTKQQQTNKTKKDITIDNQASVPLASPKYSWEIDKAALFKK